MAKNLNKYKTAIISPLLAMILFVSCLSDDYPYFIRQDVAFTIIIDGSGSVASYLPDVQTALHSMVNTMSDDDYMQFMQTGTTPKILNSWTNNKTTLRDSIDNISLTSDSELYEVAIAYAGDYTYKDHLNCVLLFGDGQVTITADILSYINNISEDRNLVVFTIGIGSYDQDNLQAIANAGSGRFYVLTDPAGFGSLYNEIKRNFLE